MEILWRGKSEGKAFQICLKNMFSNNFVKFLF